VRTLVTGRLLLRYFLAIQSLDPGSRRLFIDFADGLIRNGKAARKAQFESSSTICSRAPPYSLPLVDQLDDQVERPNESFRPIAVESAEEKFVAVRMAKKHHPSCSPRASDAKPAAPVFGQ